MGTALIVLTVTVQVLYLFTTSVALWFYSRPVDVIDEPSLDPADHPDAPPIVMLYPVLHELEETMRTTFIAMERAPYPDHLLRVVAIPNHDDPESIASLRKLQGEFPWLELMIVPSTADASWDTVWQAWDENPHAYWWHQGRRAKVRELPPKKTRQLVWALYQLAPEAGEGALLSYIDADSVIPTDYWYAGALGSKTYDVVQSTNITGNLLASWPTSFFAMDHIGWDATLYPHMTAHGKHPFYVLGKGLFYKLDDLIRLGSFHPWLTIEDPEVGLRLWTNGATMGMAPSPLIEEVPPTWRNGFTQRKRWMAGFFQTLSRPLKAMGMPARARWRARLNIVPTMALLINPFGLVAAIWGTADQIFNDGSSLPRWVGILSIITVIVVAPLVLFRWFRAWLMIEPVVHSRRDRIRYVLRVNPVFTTVYALWWILPIARGFVMFLFDQGLRWERTVKVDANHELIRESAVTTEANRARR
ncbi:glycosyltransferase family 2 protein [Luteipulveratus mongoliensis]|uniref:Glycosyltransferase 2-like domain-containing protein n=1 Tax=Luteipulveratus mongoliensis TaxID=571913 RepID=A0A0K1JPA7_9MICO|nr:glycosyltransferase family 2 protein [Luteipulveratus mongoliensis]AKU18552.1 hypothetical protein VV02_01870 [Luteipulveratus mongoliensis]